MVTFDNAADFVSALPTMFLVICVALLAAMRSMGKEA